MSPPGRRWKRRGWGEVEVDFKADWTSTRAGFGFRFGGVLRLGRFFFLGVRESLPFQKINNNSLLSTVRRYEQDTKDSKSPPRRVLQLLHTPIAPSEEAIENGDIDDDELEEIEEELEIAYQIGEDLEEKVRPTALIFSLFKYIFWTPRLFPARSITSLAMP
jgi:hypothetical protein